MHIFSIFILIGRGPIKYVTKFYHFIMRAVKGVPYLCKNWGVSPLQMYMATSSEISAILVYEFSVKARRPIYIAGHKNGATFIFTIILANVDRFQ